MTKTFREESLDALSMRLERGEISRRHFLTMAAIIAAGAPIALRSGAALAQTKELVLVNWGGDAVTAYAEAFGKPFTADTGIEVKMDGSGPTEGAIAAQAKSGKPTWDLVDVDPFSTITLGKQGYLEPIDYTVVDKSKFREGAGWEYGASTYFFSYVIAYDSEKYGDNPPKGMADFFDVEKFPGKRTLYKWGVSSWEAALLADGVAKDKLYPIDLERAHKKLAALKEHVVAYWGGGADSQTIMANGEASMGIIWSTRASLLEQDTGGQIKFIWNDGLISPGCLGVLKNNPGGKDAAMKFIASMQDPKRQLVMVEKLGQGPANPATDALLPPEKKRLNPISPENAAGQRMLDMDWYAANYNSALEAYTKLISA